MSDFPGFEKCMGMMRDEDPLVQEVGFNWLLPHASEFVEDLIKEFEKEIDPGLKGWLLELLGYARSEKAFRVFEEYLFSADQYLSHWCIHGLVKLNTAQAIDLLKQAETYEFATQEQTQFFRQTLAKAIQRVNRI